MNEASPAPADGDVPRPDSVHRHRVDFSLVRARQDPVRLEADVRYHTRDPHAITISFCYGRLEWVEWVFARDLLASGLGAPAGSGDVRIRPSVREPDSVCLHLISPAGTAHLHGDRYQLTRFLQCTTRLVPFGDEARWLDVDSFLTRVFTGRR
ncbi:SsgA family sporulation/cell division regulator [Amycolatopsis pigmentata]|uniref:SsgA family sporulation/cell division regulator n=1 Tax=Amycolatopsis pigmentata TaxID=450801 RepID=A0ABW5FZ83_9PSEU